MEPVRLAVALLDETLVVSEVRARSGEALTDDQRNAVVLHFHHNVVRDVGRAVDALIQLGSDEVEIESLMPAYAFSCLICFSSNVAYKSAPYLGPVITERWHAFLLAIHQQPHRFSSELLSRWLTTEENWPAQSASRLASEFDFAQALLSHPKNERQA